MRRSLKIAILFVLCALVAGASLFATRRGAIAGATAPEVIDPKKKLPGDPCKSSDECQLHHSCEKVGDKNVCKAPPPPSIPPGAVT